MRLIDADELFKWYTGARTKYPVGKDAEQYGTLMMYEIFDEIDSAPTVDPVKHGRWIEHGKNDNRCSLCGWGVWVNTNNFCPNCGAKMDGEENEID